ncbi:NAD-dependent epimerase/dehydratase family protein [Bradyrhizobium guangdongense]
MPLRVLVTGSSGFIGRAVTSALAHSGFEVRAASRRFDSSISPGIEWAQLPDLEKEFDWSKLLESVDVVVHLAAIAHRSVRETPNYDAINRGATIRLAKACAERNIKRLIFTSSIGAQTGSAADSIATERQVPKPVTAYDRSKLAAEEDIRASGVPFTILRPVLVYGSGVKANMALMVRLACLPLPLPIGAFKNKRSLLSIANLTSALLFCIENDKTINRTFVVCDPSSLELSEMFAILRQASGRSSLLMPFPPMVIKAMLLALGKQEVWDRVGRNLVASSEELQRLGWSPPVKTEDGLRDLMNSWILSRRKGGAK